MNTKTTAAPLTVALLTIGSLAGEAIAQTVSNIAHWDFNDGSDNITASFQAEDNGIECITPQAVSIVGGPGNPFPSIPLTHSALTIDSEDGSSNGANCFGSWEPGDYVSFGLNFSNVAIADVSNVNFDVGNYGEGSSINQVELRIFQGANELTTPSQFVKNFSSGTNSNPWTSSSDTTFNVSSLNIGSLAGNSDDYEFRIYVTDTNHFSNARIALDNFRISGTHSCVPEPSSAALLGLGGLAMSMRRRR